MYRTFFGRDLTYAEIVDFNSNKQLPYLLRGENDPWMFHQPNLVAYDGRHSLLSDLLDATLAKYNGYFTLPIQSPTMDALGQSIEARMKLQSAQVTATLQPNGAVTLSTNADVTVPITGLAVAGAEIYGGQPTARVNVKKNVPMTVSLPAPPVVVTPPRVITPVVPAPIVSVPVVTPPAKAPAPAAAPAPSKAETKDAKKDEKAAKKDEKKK